MTDKSQSGTNPKLVVAGAMAIIGVILFVTLIYYDLASLSPSRSANAPMGLILRYAIAMAVGGALVGYAISGLFGKTGILGWFLALIAGTLATIGSGVIGSLVGLLPDLLSDGFQMSDLVAVGAGVLILPFAIHDDIWLAILLPAAFLAVHFWVRKLRH